MISVIDSPAIASSSGLRTASSDIAAILAKRHPSDNEPLRSPRLDAEEQGNPGQQLILLGGGRGGVGRLLLVRHLMPGENVADRTRQLRRLLQDGLEGLLVDHVTLDV